MTIASTQSTKNKKESHSTSTQPNIRNTIEISLNIVILSKTGGTVHFLRNKRELKLA